MFKKLPFGAKVVHEDTGKDYRGVQNIVRDAVNEVLQPFYRKLMDYQASLNVMLNQNTPAYSYDRQNMRFESLESVVREIEVGLRALAMKMSDFDISAGKHVKTLDAKITDTSRLDKLEAIIMMIPGLKEAIETQEEKDKLQAEKEAKEAKEAFLQELIQDLYLSHRSLNCLKYAHGMEIWGSNATKFQLKIVKDIINYTRAQLAQIPNLGPKSLNEIEELLATEGLCLKS